MWEQVNARLAAFCDGVFAIVTFDQRRGKWQLKIKKLQDFLAQFSILPWINLGHGS